jgi:hypothetical protein
MTISPERMAEIQAVLDEIIGPPPLPKPKVVVSDGVVIRDADVHVSPADRRNSRYGLVETVSVRRPDWTTINMAQAEERWWDNIRARETDRRRRRDADPFGLGHWGPYDD